MKLYYRALSIGFLFCIFFSYLATVSLNRGGPILPSTQISSFSFVFLLLIVVLINPLLRLCKLNQLNGKELVIIAAMAIVPAGIAGFGFVTEFIPLVGSLNNPKWAAKHKEHVIPNTKQELFLNFDDNEKGFETYNEGFQIRKKEAYPIFLPKEGKSEEGKGYFSGLYKYFVKGNPDNRKFWGEIPWGAWITPLFLWSLFFIIIVLLFYSLNELVFRQWYDNEKLVFPHTELICSVLGVGEEDKGFIPAIYKHKGFWLGFSISFTIMLYNGLVTADCIPGLSVIDVKGGMDGYIKGTWLEPLSPFQFSIFFAVIGLAFLLPAEISFSIWFFFIIFSVEKLIAVHSGYVPSVKSLTPGWITGTTFITSQGGGAMIVFAMVCLWKVRYNMIAFIYKFVPMSSKASVDVEEIKRQTWPSILFFISTFAFILFMLWAKVSIGVALFVYFMILVISIVCMRLVSESGLLSFQLFFGPFHLMKNLGLLRFTSMFNIQSMASALPLFGSIFLDLKTFMAPSIATCRALSEKVKADKINFPISIFLAIIVSLVISIITSLALIYDSGLNSMHSWFYVGFPVGSVFDNVNSFAMNTENWTEVNAGEVGWTAFGGMMMAGILLVRRIFFWFPHPIGIFLFLNPMAQRWWFSFFLAWIFKTLAVKYCKPNTYKDMKIVFMGLFIGELVVVAIAALVALFGWGSMGITMNRY